MQAAGSSPRRLPPNLTSRRRCSTRRSAQWSWPHDGCLGATSGAAQHRRRVDAHREGPTWTCSSSGAAGARTALDVATGGGHVARRLREAGIEVVTSRPGAGHASGCRLPRRAPPVRRRQLRRRRHPGRRPPFRRCRHRRSPRWRASQRDASLIVDTLYMGDDVEEAEKLRDPSHVRNYSEAEWRGFVLRGGLGIDEVQLLREADGLRPWLARRVARARRPSASRRCSATASGPGADARQIAIRARKGL